MIRLEKVYAKNVWDIIKLEVEESQDRFVASNKESIIEEEVVVEDDEIILSEEDEVDIENIDLSVPDGVSIEDPVRMYLKEIGKVPL